MKLNKQFVNNQRLKLYTSTSIIKIYFKVSNSAKGIKRNSPKCECYRLLQLFDYLRFLSILAFDSQFSKIGTSHGWPREQLNLSHISYILYISYIRRKEAYITFLRSIATRETEEQIGQLARESHRRD